MQIGDKILVIDDDLQGIITKIEGQNITFESNEGFLYVYPSNKIVMTNPFVEGLFLQGKPHKKILKNKTVSKKNIGKKPPVFDLHIEKIQAKHQHLSSGQKLQIQLNEARSIIRKMQHQNRKTFVFVHGIGKGVLKTELQKMLKKQKIQFEEASFQDFGHGAALQIFLS